MSNQTDVSLEPVRWRGFGSFAFVVYVVVALTYGLAQTAYALLHAGVGAASYSAVELPLVLAVVLGLLAGQRAPPNEAPPLVDVALGTAAGYLAYVGVLAAVALPVFDLVALVRTPTANAAAGALVVVAAVVVTWAVHRFEFADERQVGLDGRNRQR